jgi:hypothetical protein
MSFGGPPPPMPAPSGPFEASLTTVASSPYTIAAAIFLLNMGGRFLPFEITKGQEKFLNQPMFRRLIIFVIFFVATRNFVTATWLALVVILCIGYLFNENSDLYLFSSHSHGADKTIGDTVALTQEEQMMLKSLSDKAEKIRKASEKPVELAKPKPNEVHKKYKRILQNLVYY